ncbi:sporulation protein YtfJ [Candidatus Magnetomorum sp. HK-1]|nr:sporulation protein YtfJ [Candidatus Magnetomorum sp. HK-1]
MEHVKKLFDSVTSSLYDLAKTENIVGKPISNNNNIAVPLIEISVGFFVAGGSGTGEKGSKDQEKNIFELDNSCGGTSVSPVGVLVVEGDNIRIEGI